MATREENLKKINEELEKMNDEELEEVAGGLPGMPMPKIYKAIDANSEVLDDETDLTGRHTIRILHR